MGAKYMAHTWVPRDTATKKKTRVLSAELQAIKLPSHWDSHSHTHTISYCMNRTGWKI